MDPFLHLLLRASIWVRRRPSREYAYGAAAAIAVAVVVVTLEWLDLWPKGWVAERFSRRPGISL